MNYWAQISTYPSLVLGPAFLAAIVSGLVSLWVGKRNREAASADLNRKIEAERHITNATFEHERDKTITDRAWIDYGLRRDIYLDLAAQIGCFFGNSSAISPETAKTKTNDMKIFHETARKARLIGSDEVVNALNDLTSSMKMGAPHEVTSANYSRLMNAIRLDIRTLNEKPPIGTALDERAFPIES